MVVEALKKLLGLGGGGDIHNDVNAYTHPGHHEAYLDYDEIISRLQVAMMEIDRLKYQILNEIDNMNTRLIEAAKRKNMEEMEEYAAEIVLKKKILRSILMYRKLIGIAINRINEARSIETLAKALAPLEYAMKGMSEILYTMSPEVVATLNSIKESTERVIRGTGMLAGSLPHGRIEMGIDDEVRREIARALREAQVESDKLIPNIPIEGAARERIKRRNLEKELLDYIKKNNGVINIKKAAEDLGLTPDQVRSTLFRLQEKGLIRVSSSGRTAEEI